MLKYLFVDRVVNYSLHEMHLSMMNLQIRKVALQVGIIACDIIADISNTN